ncbi:MAG TPA: alkaline phosphatase PhoX [Gemmatimonadales bacterium]|nr:alkaline phosphatase PhoX [Gemmatimonadales bacterium]
MRGFSVVPLLAVALACRDAATAAPISQQVFQSIRTSLSGPSTSAAAQAFAVVPAATVTPIITTGDAVGDAGYVFAPIPDGLGAHGDGNDVVVYANHELASGGVRRNDGSQAYRFARVSRLVIDPQTLAVKDATYVLDGSEQYQRLCSAAFIGGEEGFPSGYFFTGEENTGGAHDGIQLAIGRDGARHELPWLGRFAHENQIAIPGFPGKVVMAGFDDSRGASELYLYVANSEADVLNGAGQLYVFKSGAAAGSGYLTEGQSISGEFVAVQNSGSLSSASLQTAVNALGAFPFVRLEDGDYDHRRGQSSKNPAIYFVDTGAPTVLCNGVPCDAFGSIYRMEFDPTSPTQNARLTLLQRSLGPAVEWASPDNIASGKNSLMVQEDPAHPSFARAQRIYNFHTDAAGGFVDRGQAVVETDNASCVEPTGNCWETSGIIDASAWFGAGAWLFDVQAHSLPVPSQQLVNEGGQLLLLRLPGS